ncbi:hypothetical protein Z950_3473 [Sulfitobacter mediterraneus KCTC 32188]|nr:hypothetical protein Z950_3473 [Sulfitobacter mediterraneus KCTC 32188]
MFTLGTDPRLQSSLGSVPIAHSGEAQAGPPLTQKSPA